MNNKDFVVNTLKQIGFKIAQELQSNIPDMEATDIIESNPSGQKNVFSIKNTSSIKNSFKDPKQFLK